MDLTLSITILIIFVLGILIALLYLINNFLYPKANLKSINNINSGNDGVSGTNALDGITGSPALDGKDGRDGIQGLNGRPGYSGNTGVSGANGYRGSTGLAGTQGITGNPGTPSNSIVPVLSQYDFPRADSYILNDKFSFGDQTYQVQMYASVENNSRFILSNTSKYIFIPHPVITIGGGDPLDNVFVDNEIQGGSFFSTIRIAVCYGRGFSDSNNRSDDTIVYVSPPISRRSIIFKYQLVSPGPDSLSDTNNLYPIKPVRNSNEFFFYETMDTTNIQQNTLNKYHLFKGIGKYELLVNIKPQPFSDYRFNFRIIEEYTRLETTNFTLPKVNIPFDSNKLTFNNNGGILNRHSLLISNRFDTDKVIERDYFFDKNTWNQTDKDNLELSIPDSPDIILFENYYQTLDKDFQTSKTLLETPSLWTYSGYDAGLSGINAKLDLKLAVVNSTSILSGVVGMRNYNIIIPDDEYDNVDKFYLEFKLLFGVEEIPNPGPTSSGNTYGFTNINNLINQRFTLRYGYEYSLDSIDFKSVYGKQIFFPTIFNEDRFGPNRDLVPNSDLDTGVPVGSVNAILDLTSSVKVGYTKFDSGDRYSTEVRFDRINNSCYFINIPLYGYKKE